MVAARLQSPKASPTHPPSGKVNSANFVFDEFSEVRIQGHAYLAPIARIAAVKIPYMMPTRPMILWKHEVPNACPVALPILRE